MIRTAIDTGLRQDEVLANATPVEQQSAPMSRLRSYILFATDVALTSLGHENVLWAT